MTTLDVHPVTAERWDDLAALFERPGPRGGRQDTANCWCSVWRGAQRSPAENRAALCALVTAGDQPGLLGYRDGIPVAWVSVAERAHFPGLLRSAQFRPRDSEPDAWVITCFHVDRGHRGEGIGVAMLDAALRHAEERGARIVEAYPGDPPDYKGRLSWFLDAGFTPVREAGKRTVVRKELPGP